MLLLPFLVFQWAVGSVGNSVSSRSMPHGATLVVEQAWSSDGGVLLLQTKARQVPKPLQEQFQSLWSNARIMTAYNSSMASRDAGSSAATWSGLMLAVVSISIDDILWLLPFAVHKTKKWSFMAVYYLVSLLIVVLAVLYALTESALAAAFSHNVPVHALMQWLSFAVLLLYTLCLFWEWLIDKRSSAEDQQPMKDDDVQEAVASPSQAHRTHTQLGVIVFFGSLDNLAVYGMLLLSGAVTGLQLTVSVVMTCTLIMGICMGAGMLRPIVAFMEKVPIWVILAAVCIWTLIAILPRS